MDPDYLPFHPNPRKPAFTPPPGAIAKIRDVFVQTGISVVDLIVAGAGRKSFFELGEDHCAIVCVPPANR